MSSRNRRNGFTLIELMVVIAIIALLIAILLPSLQAARAHTKAVTCASNLHHISLAMANYLYGSKGTYPVSYAYPDNADGQWSATEQNEAKPFGYLHWSNFLYDSGEVSDKAFECPLYEHGGAPRTNPGLNPGDWEPGQVDQDGNPTLTERTDKQAPRMAYVANAAIIPRNKFTLSSGHQRVNVFVRESSIKYPGSTILMTEFLNNWKALGVVDSGGTKSKSHRPINPFYHIGSGFNEYTASARAPGFIYGTPSDQDTYGLLPLSEVRDKTNILDYTSGVSQINAVGRSHPTPDAVYAKKYGGAANFLYCDGHAESMTALRSVAQRQWGDRYYSITGENQVTNMSKPGK